ncbi:DeoR family glycerol-3-phosphate regulon repressor [Rhizobium leguminosarum]|uniref:Transcriptional regulator of sugar metabolism n=2 Tax=Rhizobium leguminosarum TaxID=384 RepID=I9NMR9_RHILT|nr:DeoR/GlpR family DNA-binding transcription regulator [Rhizobium leguminosarum]EJB08142.1 transcriptional regulator of sugar metabolism [Rhizobium leguminosarum bv. trifolii WSM597]NYJ11035.1 DeoR family glycerol-3-phosphate regulon repressor [Rhizobium leguminosarum]
MRNFERHNVILAMLQTEEHATIDDMASLCKTSVQTIRRDLRELSLSGRILRFHGGARASPVDPATAYDASSNLKQKEAAAGLLAEIIPDNASLFLAGGSTLAIAAEFLNLRNGLTVITNNLQAAKNLVKRADFEVHVIGGLSRPESGSIAGERAVEFIGQFKVDFAIVGTSGIDGDGTLLSYDQNLVAATRAMLENSRRRILIADGSKFQGGGVVRGVHLREFNILITDTKPVGAAAELVEAAGISIKYPPTQSYESARKLLS